MSCPRIGVLCPFAHSRGPGHQFSLVSGLTRGMIGSTMPPKPSKARTAPPAFDVHAFLRSAGVSPRTVRFASGAVIFAQGGQANSVFYAQAGGVKLSVLSSA